MDNLTNFLQPDWFFPHEYSFSAIKAEGVYPKPKDLVWMPVCAVVFVILRTVYERTIGTILATRVFGIKPKTTKYKPNQYLEEVFANNQHPDNDEIKSIAKKLSWREVEVINWFIRRRNSLRPDLIAKFCESSWRFIFYLAAFTFGMSILLQAPWFYDTLECWLDNYPHQSMWTSVYYYYMIEGGFYFSLLLTLMKDVKRKDFGEQIIHHLATLFLIIFSYLANFIRIGSMVMVVHDVSDILLELAKCFVYNGNKIADDIFTAFAVVFIISRIIVFPYLILYTSVVKVLWVLKPFPGYYFFNFLLLTLQLLHVFWTYTIIKMAVRMARVGKLEKDARSDANEDSIDEQQNDDDT